MLPRNVHDKDRNGTRLKFLRPTRLTSGPDLYPSGEGWGEAGDSGLSQKLRRLQLHSYSCDPWVVWGHLVIET